VVCKKESLEKISDFRPRSFYFDLYAQYAYFKETKQMRFTPPVQTLYALKQAIAEYLAEGEQARYQRYQDNWEILYQGMQEMGFKSLLCKEEESKILTSFLYPKNFQFELFHDLLLEKGFTIYPGKIGDQKTFRLGNLGAVYPEDMQNFLAAVNEILPQCLK
jgi:2-aminoethylphosphonate-pyruvate transaminase